MRFIFAILPFLLWASPGWAFDPVAWVERCVAHVDSLPAGAPVEAYEVMCSENPVGMCRFTSEPKNCLEAFSSFFLDETERLAKNLPDELEGQGRAARAFNRRVASLRDGSDPVVCPEDYRAHLAENAKWHPPEIDVEQQCALFEVVFVWTQWRSAERMMLKARGR